jgi:hypothetical protein
MTPDEVAALAVRFPQWPSEDLNALMSILRVIEDGDSSATWATELIDAALSELEGRDSR